MAANNNSELQQLPLGLGHTIFITGIGTDIGKTIAAAILTEALEADYWKPIQAGFDEGTDSEFIRSLISNKKTIIHPETYKLKLAASPHIAAREEGIEIDLNKIEKDYFRIVNRELSIVNSERSSVNSHLLSDNLIIEGAGGLMVPLNENEFVLDLIKKLNAKVVLVS
ncbi:MAG: dethiobiotin synthase, partial [Parafilimonas sp.]